MAALRLFMITPALYRETRTKYLTQGTYCDPKTGDYWGMNENDITAREPSLDERFMGDWVAFGMSELRAYLTKHARFAAFCDELDLADEDLAA
jgi:hypothetical protein